MSFVKPAARMFAAILTTAHVGIQNILRPEKNKDEVTENVWPSFSLKGPCRRSNRGLFSTLATTDDTLRGQAQE